MARGTKKETKGFNGLFSGLNGTVRIGYNEEYDAYSVAVGRKKYDAKKKKELDEYINFYFSVNLSDKAKKYVEEKMDAEDSDYVEIEITNAFITCYETKKGEVKPSIFIQEVNDLPF